MNYEEARAQFPVFERYAYLNAGSNGPLAQATVDAFVGEAQQNLVEGRGGAAQFQRMFGFRADARRGIAGVLGVEPTNVALTDSTSRACATVISGLRLAPDDEIVITDEEHFGLTGPVHASGARVVMVAGDEDAILGAITPKTKLIATSHVLWTTGRRLDIHRIRREGGVPLLVDGAQSVGAIPVDVGEIEYYTASAQKWLCAPEPTGALYVRDPEALPVASPAYPSQSAYEPTGAFTPAEGAARFDAGFSGTPILAGLIAAIAGHPEWRYERAAEMAARCAELLSEKYDVITPPGHSTLVSFRPPGDPTEIVQKLYERGVIIRELQGRNILRASCGWWTNEDDLVRLVEALS